MTNITSVKGEEITPLDLGEGSLNLFPSSFPPVDDVLDTIRNIDGEALRNNAKRDLRVIGKVLAFTGEQLHAFGTWLSEV